MTSEIPLSRPKGFIFGVLPWLLALGMLVIYVLTLNRGLSEGNLGQVTELSGWNWAPNLYFGPVSFLVMYPLRWLAPATLPLAVNVFTAVCAALTLAQLARSVALLPQDRTQDQRDRETSEFSLLSLRSAWLPPVFAVLVCGLSLTFWEHAVEATGEMFNLLLFAWLIRCLLEFRIDQRDSWLNRFALFFGMAISNNWGMVGFIPLFLAAIIWIKGLSFFNLPFLVRSLGYWLAGMSLFLLLPLLASFSQTGHLSFWDGLHVTYLIYKSYIAPMPREVILLLCLTSVLPVFVIGIRWPSSFGDSSPLGIFLATSLFHLVHGVLLVACIWVALDSPLSPRQKGLGYPYLPLYYLGALSVGYFSGYLLLIFGGKLPRNRRPPSAFSKFIGNSVILGVWILLAGSSSLLVAKNLPLVQANNDDPLREYIGVVRKSLPPDGAVILADVSEGAGYADTAPRFYYLQALLNQQGNGNTYLLMDSHSLSNPDYIRFLDRKHPAFRLTALLTNQLSDFKFQAVQVRLLQNLATNHPVYYLHPSFGSYFETFYLEPHGLVYALKLLPPDAPDTPRPTGDQIKENEAVWRSAAETQFPRLKRGIQPVEFSPNPSLLQLIMTKLRLRGEVDRRAQRVARFYARDLNFWGVQLQKCGLYQRAGECFGQALELDPDSDSARLNHEFNLLLQAGKKAPALTIKEVFDKFGTHRSWNDILGEGGPVDEPNSCYLLATTYLQSGAAHQAIEQFQRVLALAPDQSPARHWLAQLFLITQNYSNALEMSERILKINPEESHALLFKGAALMEMNDYREAVQPLTKLLTLQSTNYPAQLNRAICYLQSGDLERAGEDFHTVAKAVPKAYQAYYGLGEIAYRTKDTNDAILNYQLYLTNAPPNTGEAMMIKARLKELGHGKP
jgi:tetratricopeptide (TPR) repeat protein